MIPNLFQIQQRFHQDLAKSTSHLEYLTSISTITIVNTTLSPSCTCFIYRINTFFPTLKKDWYSFVIYCHTCKQIYLYFHDAIYALESECFQAGKNYLLQFPYYGFLSRCVF